MATSAVATRGYPAQRGSQLITARLRRTICERMVRSRADARGLRRAGSGIAAGSGDTPPLVECTPGDAAMIDLLVTRLLYPDLIDPKYGDRPATWVRRLCSTTGRSAGAVACQFCLLHPKI